MSEISSITFIDRTVAAEERYQSESRKADREKELAEKAVDQSSTVQNQGGDPDRGRYLSTLV